MAATNKDIAARLEEMATLLRLSGANEFKAIAFDKAARAVESMDAPVLQRVETGTLTLVPGIGASIAADIREYVETGRITALDDLKTSIPKGLIRWLDISGLGPKKIRKIHEALGITEMADLKAACEDGRVASLNGLGAKSAERIRKSIDWMERFADRCHIDEATAVAGSIRDAMQDLPGVRRIEVAGSLRRRLETIGDIDVLVSADSASVESLFDGIVALPAVVEVLARGPSKCSIRTDTGRQVDIRMVDDAVFAATWMYFTGSKAHNVALRQRARERGLTLNEYGVFPLTPEGEADLARPLPFNTEEDVYRLLGESWIPPEMREDRGEFEWIRAHSAEELVRETDIRGVLHAHSTWSDGETSIETMAMACMEAGYAYLGITDHSRSAAYANGLDTERVFAQWREIDHLNDRFARDGGGFRIFKGIESDILTDGRLDYPDEVLAGFDFVIGSVHSVLDMAPDAMLERFKRAVDNRYLTIIGHPTGRLLLRREGNAFDLEALIRHTADAGAAIEINANPWRLDMDWRHGRLARACGLMSAVCPDAHHPDGIADITYGVGIARKAGFAAPQILNTKSADALAAWFQNRH